MRHDGSGHGVKGGANVRTPSAGKTLWSFRCHDDAVLGASQMESQALGLGDWVSRNPRKKIELRIELGHVDRDWGAVALCVSHGVELGPITVQPRAGFISIKPFKAEFCAR